MYNNRYVILYFSKEKLTYQGVTRFSLCPSFKAHAAVLAGLRWLKAELVLSALFQHEVWAQRQSRVLAVGGAIGQTTPPLARFSFNVGGLCRRCRNI